MSVSSNICHPFISTGEDEGLSRLFLTKLSVHWPSARTASSMCNHLKAQSCPTMRSPRHLACLTGGVSTRLCWPIDWGIPQSGKCLSTFHPKALKRWIKASNLALSFTSPPSHPQALLALVGRLLQKRSLNAMSGWLSKVKWSQ